MKFDMQPNDMQFAAVVLCGGSSSRMGRAKADLPFGSETLLQRVVRTLSTVVSRVVVVAAANQELPLLDGSPLVVRDEVEYAGPLAGLSLGLSTLQRNNVGMSDSTDVAAFVTGCDVPFLQPKFVQNLLDRIDVHDVVVPFDQQYLHPLAAVYRVSLADQIADLLAKGARRPRALFEQVRTLKIETRLLRHADPDLLSLLNTNTPQEYGAALERAGLELPAWLTDFEGQPSDDTSA